MNTLRTAQRHYDRDLPCDLRTDDEIEADVCARRRERRIAAVRAARVARAAARLKPTLKHPPTANTRQAAD